MNHIFTEITVEIILGENLYKNMYVYFLNCLIKRKKIAFVLNKLYKSFKMNIFNKVLVKNGYCTLKMHFYIYISPKKLSTFWSSEQHEDIIQEKLKMILDIDDSHDKSIKLRKQSFAQQVLQP